MRIFKLISRFNHSAQGRTLIFSSSGVLIKPWIQRSFSTSYEEPELKHFLHYLDNLKNYEKSGVPKGAGTESDDGFDLGRMKRLMELLGNPQAKFKAVHIAGTKGKGSTAAFLSNILRAEGYSVGCYTSPHIKTIRERISVGELGEPVSAMALSSLFQRNKKIIDRAIQLENGCISHFEVLTAMAFSLFAQENVDIAVIEAGLGGARDATNIISNSQLAAAVITTIGEEHLAALGGSLESIAMAKSGIIKHGRPLVLGGPFLPHIEHILRDKASLMSSPVVLASDPGNRSTLKGICRFSSKLFQSCDILVQIERDLQLFIELFDVKLSVLGYHQLQNAATAVCAALCLRNQGWNLSDESIRAGLECTYLHGRSQILACDEAETLGLPGATIMLDGAHTRESARALANTIEMIFPNAKVVLVVAMASDKDHLAFARELLSVKQLEAAILTEVNIAGDKSRSTPAFLLKNRWIQASKEMNIDVSDDSKNGSPIIIADDSFKDSMMSANQILKSRTRDQSPGIIVVTGSLHIVSLALSISTGLS